MDFVKGLLVTPIFRPSSPDPADDFAARPQAAGSNPPSEVSGTARRHGRHPPQHGSGTVKAVTGTRGAVHDGRRPLDPEAAAGLVPAEPQASLTALSLPFVI